MYETGDYVKFLYDQYEIAEGGDRAREIAVGY